MIIICLEIDKLNVYIRYLLIMFIPEDVQFVIFNELISTLRGYLLVMKLPQKIVCRFFYNYHISPAGHLLKLLTQYTDIMTEEEIYQKKFSNEITDIII